ncbi:hypothetical protein B0J13DRAFT_627554 [Dactylonectria estremocensis]|uniref:Nudix hydrolase domain-containing protein n=1 Tax=Dactylonectria estremocensis TaxID=1079267 RepID=A0A9P9DYY3_9HYPO|nr:hypothetical protein B0J13DRAFT_627554 [Dactylonectria estremocensis]
MTVSGVWGMDNNIRINAFSGSLVFDNKDRILLLQRLARSRRPDSWEIPGGGGVSSDLTVQDACVRNLMEQTGLRPRHVERIISGGIGSMPGVTSSNQAGHHPIEQREYFFVDVDDMQVVELDFSKHQDFVWVTEEDVLDQFFGVEIITLAHPYMLNVLRRAFEVRLSGKERKTEAMTRG